MSVARVSERENDSDPFSPCRGKGWRKAVRFALTENPVSGDSPAAHREAFRLVIQDAAVDP